MPVVLQPNIKASQIDKNAVADIAAQLNIVRPLAEVLYTRGYDTPDKAARYLTDDGACFNDPFLLSGMRAAVETIKQAAADQKHITVYGDYDVDGICAVSVIMLALKHMGADADYYIPDRHSEGYGLNEDAIRQIAPKGGLLLTVDCGISSCAEVKLARELGLEVIVTDHHTPPEVLPDCIVINPKLPGDYPFAELCGAGVAFKLAQALTGDEAFCDDLLDLACLATVADVVPLVGENRLIVKKGLQKINTNPRGGLLELIRQSGREAGKLTSGDIAFALAPRLNAAGRMKSAVLGVELLLGIGNAEDIAMQLNMLNSLRQEEEQRIIDEASDIAVKSGQVRSRRIILAASDGWDRGVIGIAASKLTEKYHRPCILFAVQDGVAVGSGRSVEGINIYQMLLSIEDLLIKFGGHAMAAGVSMYADRLDDAAVRLDQYVRENSDEKLLFPVAKYDARVCLAELNARLVAQTELLAPFGMGNPAPRFRVDNVKASVCRVIGKNRNHMKIGFSDKATSVEAMLFFYRDSGIHIDSDFYYTLVGRPEISTWNDIERVSFIIDNARRDKDYQLIKDTIFHNDEKLFRAFFEQIMYNTEKDEAEHEILESRDELFAVIDDALSQDICGTLILSNHPATALAVSEFVFNNHPRCDIEFFSSVSDKNGYNTLVLGGNPDKIMLENYRCIILCDCCNDYFARYVSQRAPEAEVYAMHGSNAEYIASCPEKYRDFSRENMGKAYMSVRNTASQSGMFESMDTFLRMTAAERFLSEMLVSVSLQVFRELGFLNISEMPDGRFGISVNRDAPQNPLTNSKIYNNIVAWLSGKQ